MDCTAVQCRRSERDLCFPCPSGCFKFMVPLWSLTGTLIPAGRVYLLFTACSGRSILCAYMLGLHRDCVFPNKIQMIDLVLIVFFPSAFLQSILLPHVFFSFCFIAIMCKLHTVAIAVYNALFQSN